MFKYIFDASMKSRSIMIYCKRKMSYHKRTLPYYCFINFSEYEGLLVNNLGIRPAEASALLRSQQMIFGIPKDHVANQCRLCKKWNIDTRTLFKNADLLGWSAHTLEERVLLFQEMGVTSIQAAMLSNFCTTMSLRMGVFKAWAGIPKETNIAENFLSVIEQPPAGVPPLEMPSDDLSVREYHLRCLQWYLQWKLHIAKEDEKQMRQIRTRLKLRSFTLMRRLFDILHHEIGLTIEEIKRYDCMIFGSPNDLRKIIDNMKTFYGYEIKKLIKSRPLLHRMQYDNVVQVMSLLEKHGFDEKSIRSYPLVFVVSKYVVAERLEKLESIPELRVLMNNARVLFLLHKFDAAHVRLKYLRYLNIKYVTIRALTGQPCNFERFTRTGADKTKGKEIGRSLTKILRLEPREIHRRIKKHPYWRHIDLISMHDTLNFLLERYEPEDLHDSIQLILYPREKISEVLDCLPVLKETSKNQSRYSPSHILALCLYEIERECHFTGDGVWRYEAPPVRSRIDSTKISDHELSDGLDSGNAESENIDQKAS